ncbi:PH domain-containing protein [Cardiobacteriaceae bacterium TAE3-ERU3]|nr:PH domain-containing protein [Cardiobacteriaceae bacterium TAE3-ERU3]
MVDVAHIQAVQINSNPFDRHYKMANLLADTLGAAKLNAPMQLRYLPRAHAYALLQILQSHQ